MNPECLTCHTELSDKELGEYPNRDYCRACGPEVYAPQHAAMVEDWEHNRLMRLQAT